jgi:LPXTG-site transpeptidase (sortase) family protein
MQNISRLGLTLVLLITIFLPSVLAPGHAISPPQISLPVAEAATIKEPAAPARLVIPSIKLNDAIVPMGTTGSGELAVPSGKTSNVGWYAKGTVPGNTGSAVLDAHVFAAFAKLKNVKVGDRIAVAMTDGTTRTFAVTKAQVYKLGDLSPQELFSQNDGTYLHLITCAGALTPTTAPIRTGWSSTPRL